MKLICFACSAQQRGRNCENVVVSDGKRTLKQNKPCCLIHWPVSLVSVEQLCSPYRAQETITYPESCGA